MSYNLFEKLILHELKAVKGVTPPDEPPDFTKPQQQQDQQQQGAPPPNAGEGDQLQPPSDDGGGTGAKQQGNTVLPPDQEPTPDNQGQPPDDGGGDMGGGAPPPDDGMDGGEGDGMEGEEGEEDPNAAGDDQMQPPDDGTGGDDMGGAPEPNPSEELSQAEQEVFAELKPEQFSIKIYELKQQYKKFHSVIVAMIDKLDKSSRTTYDDNLIDFLMRKLIELKEMCKDALLKSFNTRTYIENQVELQKFIYSFNMISNLIGEIKQTRIKRKAIIDMQDQKKNNKRNILNPTFTGNRIFARPFFDQ